MRIGVWPRSCWPIPRDLIAGASPEPLITVSGRQVSTRPIAGTRPRGATLDEDRRLAEELLADPQRSDRRRQPGAADHGQRPAGIDPADRRDTPPGCHAG